ncbi:MAG: hypothetical protein WBC29_01715 [Candidatus Moraniibacteriota bacterium]
MGFFSKKISAGDKNDTHEMVDAKIHVMQHDLDEIAKNGHVEIEPDHQEKSTQQRPISSKPPEEESLPVDSPFSQSIYPPTTLETPALSLETPQAPSDAPQQESLPEDVQAVPPARPSEPLNLPTFQGAQVPAPREFMHLNIEKQASSTAYEKPPEPEPAPTESLKSPSASQESLRSGTWPVEAPAETTSTKKGALKKTTPKKISLRKTPTDKKVMSDNIILKERWGWKHFLLIVVILGTISGGAFYFWKTRFFQERMDSLAITHPNIPDISSNDTTDKLRNKPDASLPFSTTNANPFLVDVETETVSTLREQLMKNAETMRQANMTGPVPFSVVDKTNTPIAFFIFASIFNLGLSGDLLNSLDNSFTLSLFLDNGEPRTTLTITTKNPTDAQKYLTASEKTLPLSLKNILLVDTPPTAPAATFSTTSYKSTTIRYFNLSIETPLSFDYTFIDNTLIIGTSKNAERASIDVILDSKK